MRTVLVLLILGVTLAGCKKGPQTVLAKAPPPTIPAGWTVHDVADGGFTIAAPDNFKTDPGLGMEIVAPTAAESYGFADTERSSELADESEPGKLSEAQKAKGYVLILYDRSTRPIPGEERTKIEIKKESSSGTLKETADEVARTLGSGAQRRTVKMPYGDVEEIIVQSRTVGGDEEKEIFYIICNGDDMFKIRMNSTNSPAAFDTIAIPVVETFRLK